MLDRSDLRPYQERFISKIKGGDATFGEVPVGYGKTVSVLTAIDDIRKEDGKPYRALVICPKRVATNVWPQEPREWRHIQHMNVQSAAGECAARRLQMVMDGRIDVLALNYENLPWLCKTLPPGKLGELFYCVVFDEVDKMKTPGTARFRAIRSRMKEFRMRIGMTGTPASETLLDIWAPSYLVTLGQALGTSRERFKHKYFQQADYFGHQWVPRPGAIERVGELLTPWIFAPLESDTLDLPGTMYADRYFDLPPKARKHYEKFETDLVLALERGDVLLDDEGEWMDDVELDASNAAVLKNKLRQICSGFVYEQEPGGVRKTHWLHTQKIEALADLQSELMGQQLMIVYGFQAEYQRIIHDGRLGGNVPDSEQSRVIEQWNAGKVKNLAMHPASAGHGLNLQKSGAHNIAFLTLPWSRTLYDQTIGRLDRMGQKNVVMIHRFIAKDTVEEDVLKALETKGSIQEKVIAAIRRRRVSDD